MNTNRLFTTAALALALAGNTMAADATIQAAEGGVRAQDSFPALVAGQGSGKTRAEVKAELAQAQRNGSIATEGDGGAWVASAPAVQPSGKSRDAVRAELAQAIRVGALPSANTPY